VKSALKSQEAAVSTHKASALSDRNSLILRNGSNISQEQFKQFTTFNLHCKNIASFCECVMSVEKVLNFR
jgi:hypothetical protein